MVGLAVAEGTAPGDEHWWAGFTGPGLSGYAPRVGSVVIRDLIVHQGSLIAGGQFGWADSLAVQSVARWDGTTWAPLADGLGDPLNIDATSVSALAVLDGELIVAGTYLGPSNSSMQCIARLSGQEWEPLGEGIATQDGGRGEVRALTVFEGELIAAGSFGLAGADTACNIARWDGTRWHAMGTGLGAARGLHKSSSDAVYALTVHESQLIAGGRFSVIGSDSAMNLALWDGSGWHPHTTGTNASVFHLSTLEDRLLTAGSFTVAGGTSIGGIATWDGTAWSPLGDGVSRRGRSGRIYECLESNGRVFACGWFDAAGDTAATSIAAWNGNAWEPLGDEFPSAYRLTYGYALAIYQDNLVVGGDFADAYGKDVGGIARWDGLRWHPLWGAGQGMDGPVAALTVFNDRLIAGGDFSHGGGEELAGLGQWNGAKWEPIGQGTNGTVRALATYRGDLIAGGTFSVAGCDSAARIARWDGEAWHSLGTGIDGFDVTALHVHRGELIVGGRFARAGGYLSPNLARWNGVRWIPFEEGIIGPSEGGVTEMTSMDGDLIVAGRIGIAGGEFVPGIARWNGRDWSHLGGDFVDFFGSYNFPGVFAVTTYDGDLVIAGNIEEIDSQYVGGIARWDGMRWQPLGEGFDNWLHALVCYDGRLIAGGSFRDDPWDAGFNHIAQWDGISWSGLGSGIAPGSGGSIYAMAEYRGELYVAGHFQAAGIRPSAHIARWRGTSADRPAGTSLLRLSPNPVGEETAIHFFLPGSRTVRFSVHDVAGRMVYRLPAADYGGGWQSVAWTATSQVGRPLPTGTYFLRLDTGRRIHSGRAVVVR